MALGTILGAGIGFVVGGPAGAVTGASIGGGVDSIVQSKKAARATRRSNALQQRIADTKAQRERASLIREARVERARLANQAELTGVAGSSSAVSGQQGVTSGAASGISFLDTVQRLGQESNIFLQRSVDAQSRGQAFGALAGLTGTVAEAKGGFEKLFS